MTKSLTATEHLPRSKHRAIQLNHDDDDHVPVNLTCGCSGGLSECDPLGTAVTLTGDTSTVTSSRPGIDDS